MSSVAQRFDKFLSNIKLTDAQIEDAITKHHGVRRALHEAYYTSTYKSTDMLREILVANVEFTAYKARTISSFSNEEVVLDEGYVYSSSLLVGSYGKRVAIAPPSDIDILFQMPWEYFQRYDSYAGNGQSQLLQDVKKVLQRAYPTTSMRADGQVVIVPFSSYKVEVLPVFKLTDERYWFPDTNSGGSWRYTHPRAEMRNIRDSNKRANGNTVKLIKMIKAWKHYCSVPVASLVIELRAVNFLENWSYFDKGSMWYDWMIRDFFSELLKYVNSTCKIPGIDEVKHYGNAWESKAKTAAANSSRACELESTGNYMAATTEWKKLFGSRFYYLED